MVAGQVGGFETEKEGKIARAWRCRTLSRPREGRCCVRCSGRPARGKGTFGAQDARSGPPPSSRPPEEGSGLLERLRPLPAAHLTRSVRVHYLQDGHLMTSGG